MRCRGLRLHVQAPIALLLLCAGACTSGQDGAGVPQAGGGSAAGTGGPSLYNDAGGGGASGSSGPSGGATGNDGGAGAAGTGAGAETPSGSAETFGEVYRGGQFHLGPVDWEESEWHNACAPLTKYAPAIRTVEGTLLAGLWNGIPNVAGYCDACIRVETARGKLATLRVVTYGDTSMNSIDVSPDAYTLLDSGEYPRTMSWQLAACPNAGPTYYEFQTGSSEWWTSLWVRNARLPLERVEVESENHPSFVALERGSDGTLTDAKGFGVGRFTLRLTAVNGAQLEASFDWPAGGIAGQTLQSDLNF